MLQESNFVTKVEQLQTMIDVNSKLGAIETSQDDLKDAQVLFILFYFPFWFYLILFMCSFFLLM